MTVISLAAVFHTWGKPQFDRVDRISLTRARELVSGCLTEMYAEIDRELDRQDAAAPERQQVEAAMAALESSFGGVLAAVRVTRPPQQQQQDPYGHGPQDPGQDPYRDQERRQQQQQPQGGGNPFAALGNLVFGRPEPREQPPPRRRPPGPQDLAVVVMSQTLYDQLFSVCEAVDRILEAAEPPPEAEEVPWARTSDFLKEAHPLLTAYVTGNGERALEQIGLLEERLRTRYGIEVKVADEETASLFTIYPNSDPLDGSYETRIPALLVDGKVWQKGEALGPVTEQYAPEMERGQSHGTED